MKKVLFLLLAIGADHAQAADLAFEPAGDMPVAASQHRDVLLPDGRVLITGGQSGEGGIAAAQIYDPKSKTFAALPAMTEPRFVHATDLLPDGRVLITSGFSKAGQFLQSSEYFDGKGFTKGPDLVENRDNQRTVALKDGRVFIEGGDSEKIGYIASTELFDPKTDTFAAGPVLPVGRAMDTISLLIDGRVLMAGGMKIVDDKQVFLDETVIFDPETDSVAAGPTLNTARKQHKATALENGTILVTGGMNDSGETRSAELFENDAFTKLPDMATARREHCSARLPDGRVIIAGGYDGHGYVATTEIFDPASKTFSLGPDMTEPRGFHTCTVLQDGSILVAGGTGNSGALKSAEVLRP